MDSISVNQFREKLKHCVERVIQEHQPLKVTRRNGEDFVVISAEDWERERETLYVLQNQSLMQQIAESQLTHNSSQGYKPSKEELALKDIFIHVAFSVRRFLPKSRLPE